MNKALLIFVKNLIPGQVKTRLAATLGNDLALRIYKQLLEHTHMIATEVEADKFVYYSDFIEEQDTWSNKHFIKRMQTASDLGGRMQAAFLAAFNTGYDSVVIIGSDCPTLDNAILQNAFNSLIHNDVVIGPAKDGGYYLLGMKSYYPELFDKVPWSTPLVLKETIARCADMALGYELLPVLDDVDEEKDLIHLKGFAL